MLNYLECSDSQFEEATKMARRDVPASDFQQICCTLLIPSTVLMQERLTAVQATPTGFTLRLQSVAISSKKN